MAVGAWLILTSVGVSSLCLGLDFAGRNVIVLAARVITRRDIVKEDKLGLR